MKKSFKKESEKEAPSLSAEEIKEIVEETLDEKLHPIYKMLVEMRKRERIKFSEVVGGIGYILGIIGIIAFFMRKKK